MGLGEAELGMPRNGREIRTVGYGLARVRGCVIHLRSLRKSQRMTKVHFYVVLHAHHYSQPRVATT